MKNFILNWIANFYDLQSTQELESLFSQSDYFWEALGWMGLLLGCTLVLSTGLWWLTKEILLGVIYRFAAKTETNFDDILVQKKFFNVLAHIFPLLLLDYFFSIIFFAFPNVLDFTLSLNEVFIALVILIALRRLVDTTGDFLKDRPAFVGKPLKSYVQTINILVTLFFLILMMSLLTGQSPVFFLTSIGAATAIILLIFKDSILGLVASIQMSANDMIRLGDWITMEKYGADGDVIEITLTSVKVQNWDKTITTIPTYAFISESFKNWRGMSESGGRRITRSINIQIDSIKFASLNLLEKLNKVNHISQFVQARAEEIRTYNEANGLSDDQINARKQTNIGLFRRYLEFYLKNHERIHQGMTLIVRQLAPTEHGVPIQIYCFTNTTAWGDYENIMGDIFDHVFAVVKEFELNIHEAPSGKDFRNFITKVES
jgi:miniconductance mechanosensitive channel